MIRHISIYYKNRRLNKFTWSWLTLQVLRSVAIFIFVFVQQTIQFQGKMSIKLASLVFSLIQIVPEVGENLNSMTMLVKGELRHSHSIC